MIGQLLTTVTTLAIMANGQMANVQEETFIKVSNYRIVEPKASKTGVYVGCYKDKEPRMLKDKRIRFDNSNSKEKCEEFCQAFKWYAMQSKEECFCGDATTHMEEKPQKDCDEECPGNKSQICGGTWRNSLYRYLNLKKWTNQGALGEEVLVNNLVECAHSCLQLDDCYLFNAQWLPDGTVLCQTSTLECYDLEVTEDGTHAYIANQLVRDDDTGSVGGPSTVRGPFVPRCTAEWVMGQAGSKCNDVCGAVGKTCDAERQSTLTTNGKTAYAFRKAGYNCQSFVLQGKDFDAVDGAPLSTGRDEDDCCRVKSGTQSVCDGNGLADHSPLCFCK